MRYLNKLITILALSFASLSATACATGGDEYGDEYVDIEAEAAAPGQFDLWRSSDGQFRFRLVAGNKNILLSSEGYTTRVNAINGVLSVLSNGVDPAQYEVAQARNGKYFLRLRSPHNGQIIGFTQLYASKYNAQRAVGSCVRAVTSYLANVYENPARAHVAVEPAEPTVEGASTSFSFTLFAKDGTKLVESHRYASEPSAWNGAFLVQEQAAAGAPFAFTQTEEGHRFSIKASNGLVIATSPAFDTREAAFAAAESTRATLATLDIL
jgi:uncharacterized protein